MAILIPSKNIYDKQNPKVRDNVIDRIEVGAVEVVPDNEYETPVFNKSYISKKSETNETTNSSFHGTFDEYNNFTHIISADTKVVKEYTKIPQIIIPKNLTKKTINKIFIGLNANKEPYIRYSLLGISTNIIQAITENGFIINQGIGSNSYSYYFNWSATKEFVPKDTEISTTDTAKNLGISADINAKIMTPYTEGSATYFDATATYNYAETEKNNLVSTIKCSIQNISLDNMVYKSIRTDEAQTDNLWGNSTENYSVSENNDYYIINNIKILTKITYYTMIGGGTIPFYSENGQVYNYPAKLFTISYQAKEISLTIYGNTIGIDLTDNTVYINGKTKKKVYSVEGNELMQTSNYYQSTDTNAITRAFTETQTDYAKGKETATIRCSIGDYYDYDSGDKVISVDNSTEKMSFKLYDQVIPMVYGADGKDHPTSKNQDGSPKVFQVLGSKIYYDGAVWQELSLQEV